MGMSQQSISYRLKTGKFRQDELEKMAEIMGCEYHSVFTFPDGNRVEQALCRKCIVLFYTKKHKENIEKNKEIC